MTYAGGRRNSILNEYYTGGAGGFSGSTASSQVNEILVFGTAKRPVLTADGSVTVLATKKLSFVENNSYSDVRMDGNETYAQYSGATQQTTELNFQYLGIRLFTTSLDARYQFTPKFGAYIGYQYSDRLIGSIQSETNDTFSGSFGGGGAPPMGAGGGSETVSAGEAVSGQLYRQSNHLNAAIFGFNWSIWQALRRCTSEGRDRTQCTAVAHLIADANYSRDRRPSSIQASRNYGMVRRLPREI